MRGKPTKFSYIFLAALGVFIIINMLGRTAYDISEIEQLADIFESKTRGLEKGRNAYPLPDNETGRVELEYLREIIGMLAGAEPEDCLLIEERVRERALHMKQESDTSLFTWAAKIQRRRRGDDTVRRTSRQLSPGMGVSRRSAPIDTDKRIELLKQRTDRIKMVEDATATLRDLARTAAEFADTCPDESAVIRNVLDYVLDE